MANVLIIDDDADSCEVARIYLTKSGHSVKCVPNGPAALSALGEAVPDFIVLDLLMPGMDGIALLGVIRSYLRWSTIPVVILTAYPEDPRLGRVVDLGVTRIFSKSNLDLAELLEYINRRATPPPAAPGKPSPSMGA
jgi:CheY-like chemotaxis protein